MFKLPIPTRLTDYLGEAVVWTVIILQIRGTKYPYLDGAVVVRVHACEHVLDGRHFAAVWGGCDLAKVRHQILQINQSHPDNKYQKFTRLTRVTLTTNIKSLPD